MCLSQCDPVRFGATRISEPQGSSLPYNVALADARRGISLAEAGEYLKAWNAFRAAFDAIEPLSTAQETEAPSNVRLTTALADWSSLRILVHYHMATLSVKLGNPYRARELYRSALFYASVEPMNDFTEVVVEHISRNLEWLEVPAL